MPKALLDAEAPQRRNDGVPLVFQHGDVLVILTMEVVIIVQEAFVQGVIAHADALQGDVIALVDEVTGGVGNGDDLVGHGQGFFAVGGGNYRVALGS